jgi:hypothetical protein
MLPEEEPIMTKSKTNRRTFISTSARAGIAVCGLCACPRFLAFAGDDQKAGERIWEPEKLCYCGYSCPDDCKLLQATLKNDVELKKEAYKEWQIEERFGVELDPDQLFCYGCKTADRPEGIVLAGCDVRACARDKGLDCCIECQQLAGCDKDLWQRYPDFKKQVVEMQKQYRAQQEPAAAG